MTEITIPLSDERLVALRERAESAGLSAEEYLRRCVEEWLSESEPGFAEAAAHVLRKNAELYRRLA